jgi:3-dehydrosphinganine reductase
MMEVDYFDTLYPDPRGCADDGRARSWIEALRDELCPHGVHIGCVFPPDVDTSQPAEENQCAVAFSAGSAPTYGQAKPNSTERRCARRLTAGTDVER